MPNEPSQFDAFEDAPTGLLVVDRSGTVTRANGYACELFAKLGHATCPEGTRFVDVFREGCARVVRERIAAAIDGARVESTFAVFRASSARVELRFAASADSCVVSVADVSAAVEAEQRLAAHFTRTPLASIEWNLDRTARLWNPAAERIFGFTAEDAAERDLFPEIVAPESRASVDRVWEALLTATGGDAFTNTNVTRDGRTILCRWYNTPLRDADGNVVAVASLAEDITESEVAARRLRDSERRLQLVVDRLPVLVWALDHDHRPVFWNEHAQRVTGYTADEILHTPEGVRRIFPADARDIAAFASRDFDAVERPLPCADGGVRRVLWSNVATRAPVPGWAAWGVGIDVTELREARRAARESERRFREVFHAVELAGVLIDDRGVILDCNDAICRTLERERDELIGADWFDVSHQPHERASSREELNNAIRHGAYRRRTERRITSATGATRDLIWTRSLFRDADGRPVGACAFGLDVTDSRRAEAELERHREHLERLVEERTEELAESTRQLAEAERLASIGQLAAGIGHDINNILLPVRCHLDVIAESDEDPVSSAARAVSSGLDVLGRLARSLQAMNRDAPVPVERDGARSPLVDVESWWAEAGPLIARAVPHPLEFDYTIEAGLAPVMVDHHELTQVVLNLVINAVEAIDDEQAGRVHLDVSSEADSVAFAVTDNGRGMPEHVRRHARDPFFSTKARGMSTGLGLSIVHAVVTDAGGRLEFDTDPGSGTTACITLPGGTRVNANLGERKSDPAESASPAPSGVQALSAPIALVRVSDPRTRSLHEQFLLASGWRVADADRPPKEVDLLVTDDTKNTETPTAHHVMRVGNSPNLPYSESRDASAGLTELRALYSRLQPSSAQPGPEDSRE